MKRYMKTVMEEDFRGTKQPTEVVNPIAVVRDAVIALLALIILATCWPVRTVPTGSRGVITVGGAIRGLQNEGFTVVLPWQKLDVFSIRAEADQVENAEGSTSDTQPVHVTLTVRYAIVPDRVTEVYEKYSHTGDLSQYVDTATREAFKAVTAKYSAPDLIAQRAAVSADITGALRKKLDVFGANVISIDVTSFQFSESYMKAISDKVNQEQLRLAAENKLKTVEAEQKQKVAIAEAEANAVKATADGDAYATMTKAKAEAGALQVQNDALARNKDVLELRRIQVEQTKADRWNGALPTAIYGSAPIPFLNAGKQYGSPSERNSEGK